MRQYRGLTKEGKWVYGYFLINPNGRTCIYDPEIGDMPVIPETVGQFTGLCDKNGTEIYEGDIVRLDTPQNPYHPSRNKTIIFNLQFAQFCVEPCTSIRGWKSVEVIGNKWEHPNLMEQDNG